MQLEELLAQAAEKAEADRVEINGEPYGPVHRWVREHIDYPADQEFWIVALLTAELNDRDARREGYANQCDRAAKLAFATFPPRRDILF